jgi:hypothetical protein
MDGLATGDAGEQSFEIGGIGAGYRRIARRAVADDAAALLRADDSERGGLRVRAAFDATGDVERNAVAGERHMVYDLGGKRARSNQAMRASGGARAGGDAAAWV